MVRYLEGYGCVEGASKPGIVVEHISLHIGEQAMIPSVEQLNRRER
jgi:hypothetical protein